MEKKKQNIKTEAQSNSGMTYTNPSLLQSKGLEAERGEELYFVDNALNLQNKKKHGKWDKALAGDTKKGGTTYRSETVGKSQNVKVAKVCIYTYEWLFSGCKNGFSLAYYNPQTQQ